MNKYIQYTLVFLLVLAAPSAWSAIVLEDSISQTANNVTTHTISFSPAAQTNGLMVVTLTHNKTDAVSTMKWDGTDLTQLGSNSDHATGDLRAAIWYLVNPTMDGSSKDLVIVFASKTLCLSAVQVFSDVNQTTPFESNGGTNGTGTSATAQITFSASNTTAIGVVRVGGAGAITVSGGGVELVEQSTGGSKAEHDFDDVISGSPYTMTWSISSNDWCTKIGNIQEDTGGAPAGVQYRRRRIINTGG